MITLKKIFAIICAFLKFTARLLLQCGLDLRLLRNLIFIPWYFNQRNSFIKKGGKISSLKPIIFDRFAKAGSTSHIYFHQDLLVAQYIFKENPIRHIDIGSRIDGFVAHVASFRKIEVLDLRSLPSTGHENI